MKLDVLNRWTAKVQFTAIIECAENASPRIKAGLALQWGYKNDADLRGAVLSGADLRGAVLRDADLSDAVLSGAVLRGADLSGADLRGAVLSGADLRGADLRGADLRGADLRGAVLSDADLSGADLRGAVLSENLKGIPIVPHIDAAILHAIDSGGKLDMGTWHTCETTHCRAGWAITLAGAAGAALEWAMGSAGAGALIYAASRPGKPIPNFYAGDQAALDDIRAGAEADPIPVAEVRT